MSRRRAERRFYSTTEDFRDPYSRDRDRVIHCSSFRRLEYKTQVFINHHGDYFRTRLTHSLEVSQIARTLCKELGYNDTLAETIALAHDLGHTPFGHVGGDTLDRCMKNAGCANGFEHNFQSFRVVTALEKRYPNFDGLDLTFATLEGILKHSQPYRKSFIPALLDKRFDLDKHPSIEAVIVDHADEIAYISHDIDDGVKYGLITFEQLFESELAREVHEKVSAEGLDVGDELYRYRFVSTLIRVLVTAFLNHSAPNTQEGVQCATIDAKEALPVGFEPELATKIKKLKKLMFHKLYRHEHISSKMFGGKQCIEKLFDAFSQDATLLPEKFFLRQQSHRNPKRVVADYIAGMSDRYALKRYRELYGFE